MGRMDFDTLPLWSPEVFCFFFAPPSLSLSLSALDPLRHLLSLSLVLSLSLSLSLYCHKSWTVHFAGGDLLMEMPLNENSQLPTISSNDVDHHHDNLVSDLSNHGGTESKHEIAEEEVRGILEIIASTGKFWHDWDKLKSLLSFKLKQVLSEYPEAKMTTDQQNSSLGETYPELVKRLDEALLCFIEGPPFTLQRLCEILLAAQSIYSKLSKLALALEKNLLVTSTLTICTDPYPPTMMHKLDEPDKESEEPQLDKESEEPQLQSNSVQNVQNGIEPIIGDRDEIMAEVEEVDVDDDMTIDMEAFEEIVGSSETNSVANNNS